MDYTINELAKMAGVSTRTLRYYDEIGLLRPRRIPNGYRVYGRTEVDILQQILFYRELGMTLEETGRLLRTPDYDKEAALSLHLKALQRRKDQLDKLIDNVTKTIGVLKGETTMTDAEKFEGFKQDLIDENEKNYGAEIRAKYGADTVARSNDRLKSMTKEQFDELKALEAETNAKLGEAFRIGDPDSPQAQEACALHKKWITACWGHYDKEAHMGLVRMYTEDKRFTAYYDKIAPGCAAFLLKAMRIYCAE
jgi:DNA-binding transcriptional MerR regulator